jgi:hypothetical protein
MAEDVTKKLITQLYKKMEADASNSCKARSKDEIEYKICFYQKMSNNARNLISKLNGQMGACIGSKNPLSCRKRLQSIIDYLRTKEDKFDTSIQQLKNLQSEV